MNVKVTRYGGSQSLKLSFVATFDPSSWSRRSCFALCGTSLYCSKSLNSSVPPMTTVAQCAFLSAHRVLALERRDGPRLWLCPLLEVLGRALTKHWQVSPWCFRPRSRWTLLIPKKFCWSRRPRMTRQQLYHISRSSVGAETKSVAETKSPYQPPVSLADHVRICGFLSNQTPSVRRYTNLHNRWSTTWWPGGSECAFRQ